MGVATAGSASGCDRVPGERIRTPLTLQNRARRAAGLLRRAARRSLNTIGDPFFWATSRAEIRHLLEMHGDGSPDGVYEVFDRYRGMGWYRRIGATQMPDEFKALIEEVRARGPRTIVEIGTARGGSLLAWCRLAEEAVVSIDLPGGIHGGGYVEPRARLYREFTHGRPHAALHLLRQNSHSAETKRTAMRLLGGRRIDFLFIDGDHTYEGVSKDFALWRPLVASGGLVALHDVARNREQPSIDVHRFWGDIRREFATRELVANPGAGYGIGLVSVS